MPYIGGKLRGLSVHCRERRLRGVISGLQEEGVEGGYQCPVLGGG